MFEWLGIELDPSGLAILANPIGFFAAFSFPLMIFAAFLVSGLVGPLERLARRSERLGRLLDSAIEKARGRAGRATSSQPSRWRSSSASLSGCSAA